MMTELKWTKLVGNLSFNPVAALTGELMDKIVDNNDLLAIIRPMISTRLPRPRSAVW